MWRARSAAAQLWGARSRAAVPRRAAPRAPLPLGLARQRDGAGRAVSDAHQGRQSLAPHLFPRLARSACQIRSASRPASVSARSTPTPWP